MASWRPPQKNREGEAFIERLSQADVVLLVTDIADFEGTFSRRLALQCGSRLIVIGNKVDLLPPRTNHTDVSAWLAKRLEDEHIPHIGCIALSASGGVGLTALRDMIRQETKGRGTVGVTGAAQVGKTTILQALNSMAERGEKPKKSVARRGKGRRRRKKAVAPNV